jgi:CRP/FNR family transcriptional regulator, cyclic AMP receptor protein
VRWKLLAGVPDDEVKRLLALARRRRFGRNEVVFHYDDPGDSLHLIARGRFAIKIATRLGEATMIGVRGPGEHFGEMALLGSGPRRAATIVALEPGETFAVQQAEFERLRRLQAGFDSILMRMLADEVRLLDERLLESLYCPAEKRLLRRLNEMAAMYDCGGADAVEVPLTQQQLAELTGASRATVSQILREEEERGTIQRRRGRTVVLDRQQLARRAR